MTLKPWHSLVGFGVALFFGLFGVSCLSCGVLERDRGEAMARRKATLEENVRLALWRMDSELAPLVANESARPPATYQRFFAPSPYVQLHFQLTGNNLTSPQAGVDAARWAQFREKVAVDRIASILDTRREVLGREEVASNIALGSTNPQYQQNLDTYSAPVQSFKNAVEWGARTKLARQSRGYSGAGEGLEQQAKVDALWSPSEAAMVPLWVGEELLLARRTTVDGARRVQGVWLDWDRLGKKLLADVRDLLPSADLVPVPNDQPSANRVLATLPVRLEPGTLPLGPIETSPEVTLVLVTAWAGVIVAALAFGVLLLGAVSLSERRGAFVSAVTHELRTPLTTFRMYTEMLSEGMVRDEAKQKKYLDTLRKEAIRLGHLVENVLSYARIERGRARAQAESLTVRDLYARFEERLRDRAGQVGMALCIDLDEDQGSLMVSVETSAVDQILFNLVDNACKYAAGAEDERIHLSARPRGRSVELIVSDHGPGIRGAGRKVLFEPFSKSAHEAANSAPGVGLGLALSRRLARAMKGDLRYDDGHDGGACFVLSVPRPI